MNKLEWQILDKLTEADYLKYPDINPVVLQLLFNRGIKTEKEIDAFLNTEYPEGLIDPFVFSNMNAAVDLIIKHIKAKNKITIYGDYDADGVTSSAVLVEILRILKANAEVYIPHRVDEGYGLNLEAVKKIAKNDTRLLITVDSGIRSKQEVETAKDLGLDVIISDHHLPPESVKDLPEALIINQNNTNEEYPYKNLAGVGVAFKIAQALISKSKLNDSDKQLLVDRNLDVLTIGTIADCVSLDGENRIFAKAGLKIISKTKRLGLQKLLEVAGTKTAELDSWHIGFQIAPRINAAGRMDHANIAFELLTANKEAEANSLANKLNLINSERQSYTDDVMDSILKKLDKDDSPNMIVEICPNEEEGFNNGWNEGIMGLVAGKLCNMFYRPVIILSENGDAYKGSGRSISGINIIDLLNKHKDHLMTYGGHPLACGLKIKKEKLADFKKAITVQVDKLFLDKHFKPSIAIDGEISLMDINENLLKDVDALKPYGEGNPRPIFLSRLVQVFDVNYLGAEERHLKLRLKQDGSRTFNAIGFNMVEMFNDIKVGDSLDICYNLEMNHFNGRSEIQLKIVDIRLKI